MIGNVVYFAVLVGVIVLVNNIQKHGGNDE